MPKAFNRAIKIAGEVMKPGSSTVVQALELDVNDMVLLATGTTVPTAGEAGYAVGCEFIKTNGTSNTTVYVNEGTTTSCSFVAAVTGSNQLLVAQVNLSSAQILALNATPVSLVA